MKTVTTNNLQFGTAVNSASFLMKVKLCAFILFSIFYYSETVAQAVLVKDINSGSGNSTPSAKVKIGTTFYFAATDGVNGIELWKSNGTTAGTVMVKDINPGSVNSSPTGLVDFNGTLFFAATDGVNGVELWKSDGTSSGTVMVKDIHGTGNANPAFLVVVNGTLFFSATDAATGNELWKSDGTNLGTVQVKNIFSGPSNSTPTGLTNFGNTLYFAASDGNSGLASGTELWKSDGTDPGTVLVKDINPGTFPSNPANLTVVGSLIYFIATDGAVGVELWKSNGTTVGTARVRDIRVGSQDGAVTSLTNINDTLFFSANDGVSGIELWKSTGDSLGTVLVADINSLVNPSSPTSLTEIGNRLMFSANGGTGIGVELYKSNGTSVGTVNVKNINLGNLNSSPANFINASDTLFFTADDAANGIELWKSDGTLAGTNIIANINPGSASSSPSNIIEINDTLYFTATDGTNGIELWRYNPCYLPLVDITKIITGNKVCSGANGTVTVAASQTNVTYQAFIGATPVGSAVLGNGGNLVLTIPSGSLPLVNNIISVRGSGCSISMLTDTALVVVNNIPTAAVSGGASICAGNSTPVTFTLTGAAPWTLTYSNGSTNTTPSAINTSPYILNATGAGTYTIVSISDLNCSSSVGTGSAVVTVLAIPNATVSGGDTICPGSTTPVNFAFTGTGPWNLVYTDGSTNTTVSSIATSPYILNTGTAGTYSVDSISDANCPGTSTGSAVVGLFSTFPTATVSGGDTTCSASVGVTFTLTGTPPWELTYSNGTANTTVSNILTSPYNLLATVSGTYTAVSIEDVNCTGTTSDSAVVQLVAAPTATISGSGSICPGGSDTLSIALTGTPPWDVIYVINGSTTVPVGGILTSPFYFGVSTVGTYTIAVGGVQDANCAGTGSGSAVVSSVTVPTANISGSATICPGETDSLVVTLTGASPWNIEYSDGSGTTPVTGILISPYYLPVNTIGNYTLTSVSDANCNGTPTGNGTVTGLTAPTATISGSGLICFTPPSSDTLSVQLTGTSPWNFTYTNGTITTPVTAVISASYELILSDTGTYTITTVEDAICTATGSGSGTIAYNNLNSLLASFSYVVNGLQATFTNLSQNGNIYFWSFGDGDTSTLQNPIHTYASSGNYNVTLLVSDGCSADDTTVTIGVGVGIEEGPIASTLAYYPNPAKDELTIKLNVQETTSIKLRILQSSGQVVYEEQVNKFNGDYSRTVNVSDYASGFYFVQIVTDKEVVNRKITIAK